MTPNTPASVLQEREELARELPKYADGDFSHIWWRYRRESTGVHPTTPKLISGLQRLLRHSEIVIWDTATQVMSCEGSGVFMETKVPETLCPTNQLWCFADGTAYDFPVEHWRHWLAIEEDCTALSLLVMMTPPASSAILVPLFGEKSGIPHFRLVHTGDLMTLSELELEDGHAGPLTAAVIAARMFLDTKIPMIGEATLPKNVRKHWDKQRLKIPTIRLVTLRETDRVRVASPFDTQSNFSFSHRFVVKGHWRSQPWGAGMELRRPTYIFPHIKGPSDKPLILKQTIYNAVR